MDSYVLVKGKVWQGERDKFAEAFLVRNDKILVVGDYTKVKNSVPTNVSIKEIDAGENLVLPGMTDSHLHLLAYVKWKMYVDLSGARSFKDAVDLMLAERDKLPAKAWLRGVNYDETGWLDVPRPTRKDLDKYFSENPIVLDKGDGHKHIANTLAFKAANLLDVKSIDIPRDKDGECIGVLNESAVLPMLKIVGEIYETKNALYDGTKKACTELLKHGITAIHDCDAPSYGLGGDLSIYQALEEKGELPIRVLTYHTTMPSYNFTSGYGNDMLAFAGFKVFTDGATTARTAALSFPYADDASTCGVLNHSDEELFNMIEKAHVRGIQCQIHAIGDVAIKQILAAIEKVIAKHGTPKLPYRINHCIITTTEIREKIKQLNVAVDIQPAHPYCLKASYPIRLGVERCKNNAYCFKSLFETGCVLSGGSDIPCTTTNPNPWMGIWTLCTRSELSGEPMDAYDKTQVLPLEEALNIFTCNAWQIVGKDDYFGKIKPGYKADFSVLDRDPFTQPLSELREVKNVVTYCEGKEVWRA